MQATPEFQAALEHFQRLSHAGLDQSPEAHAAWEQVIRHAPREFLDLANQLMREMDLLPKPAGLDANGRPVYRLSDVASKLGIPEDEAMRAAEEHGFMAPPPVMRAH